MPIEKTRIITFTQDHPSLTLREIGENFNVSKQYIHKVLRKNNITRTRLKFKKVAYCSICGNPTEKTAKVCAGNCYFQYYYIRVNCAFCRVSFYKKRSQIVQSHANNQKHLYCSMKCYGKGQSDLKY